MRYVYCVAISSVRAIGPSPRFAAGSNHDTSSSFRRLAARAPSADRPKKAERAASVLHVQRTIWFPWPLLGGLRGHSTIYINGTGRQRGCHVARARIAQGRRTLAVAANAWSALDDREGVVGGLTARSGPSSPETEEHAAGLVSESVVAVGQRDDRWVGENT